MAHELVFDFTNLTDHAVGTNGVTDGQMNALADRARTIDIDLAAKRANGAYPYRDLPCADVTGIIEFARMARTKFENFVNVGIGGSSLGPQAVCSALNHPYHNLLGASERGGMRMFFADNIDPDLVAGIFDVAPPESTLYTIITKSGSTAETMSTLLLVRARLEARVGAAWRDHIVVITDPEKGDLRRLVSEENITAFDVPPGVGGRFSVLTPVGLLPAACAGVDIKGLLDGAAAMDARMTNADALDNPADLIALYHYLFDTVQDKRMSVMMPYASGLSGLADWYRQLWAESLGKRLDLEGREVFTGPTPIKALGVTDQHSQVQLYVEGPHDKVFTILSVESFAHDLPMTNSWPGVSSFDYLGGLSMAELMHAERRGTLYALKKSGRPAMTVTFPEVSAYTVGQFLYCYEAAVVVSGALYGIDPLDQPGVEAGKVAAFALMGREGYEDRAAEIRAGLTTDSRYVK